MSNGIVDFEVVAFYDVGCGLDFHIVSRIFHPFGEDDFRTIDEFGGFWKIGNKPTDLRHLL